MEGHAWQNPPIDVALVTLYWKVRVGRRPVRLADPKLPTRFLHLDMFHGPLVCTKTVGLWRL